MLLAGALAASVQAAEADPVLVDAIVRKIEADGILDRAMERSLLRLSERRLEAQRSTQAQRQAQAVERARLARKVAPGGDHIRGKAQAEVSLIEYSDFECPYCKREAVREADVEPNSDRSSL